MAAMNLKPLTLRALKAPFAAPKGIHGIRYADTHSKVLGKIGNNHRQIPNGESA